ncbi:hypothetical protein ACQ4PT_055790 [Festuca glaucescens]
MHCRLCRRDGHRSGGCPLFGARSAPPPSAAVDPPPRAAGNQGRFPVTPHPFAFAMAPPPGYAAPQAAAPTAGATPAATGPPARNLVSPYSPISPLDFAGASCSRGTGGAGGAAGGGGGNVNTSDDSDSTDSDPRPPTRHPAHIDVYMPPVDPRSFEHIGFAYVHPEAASPGPLVLSTLLTRVPQGMAAHTALGPHGATVVLFRTRADREAAVDGSPFPVLEHSVYFERHEEAPNRLRFTHAGYAALALMRFPFDQWTEPRIQGSVGSMGNPMEFTQVCMSGRSYAAVMLVIKYENYFRIPQDLDVKNADGDYTVVEVQRIRRMPLGGGGGRGGGGGGGGGGGWGGGGWSNIDPPDGPPRGDGPSGWRPDSLRPDGPPSSRFGGNSGCPQCRTPHAGRSWPAYVPAARPDAAPAAGELSKGGEGEFSIDIPARCTGHGRDAPFSAITPGGVPTHTDICLGACDRFFHIVAHGGPGETAYFAVPREMASPGVVGPRGFAHINLVTGAVGVIDQIERAPGVATCLSVRVLADAMTCASPLDLVPHRGVLSASVGGNSAARDLSPALRAAAAPAPVTMQVAAPVPATTPVAMQVAAPAPVQAPAPAPAPRKRGRPAKATAPAAVPANAVAAPPLPSAAVPLKRSARVRDMGGHLFESVMERAVRLKAMKAGNGDAAPSAPVPPPFRTDEIVAMARACQLPDEDVSDLLSASAVPEAAP